ncbi:MAG TPA: SRPBCC family protein [Bradyrhizobium sp.]
MKRIEHNPGAWAEEFTSEAVWRREQARFGSGAWSLIGLARDVAADGDWITATLGGKSVFVQRFGDDLRGFENVCAHRFYPLRIGDRGNGAIRCGFHGWMYNGQGVAVGIPMCEEMFGRSRREIDRRLTPIEVETCGGLVFGRLAGGAAPGLAEFLGDMSSALTALTAGPADVLAVIDQVTEANWKLCYHITLDDYHLPTVHPESFGAGGYLKPLTYRYFACGRHSAMFTGIAVLKNAFVRWIEDCRAGKLDGELYRIVQIFPNLFVALFPFEGHWFTCVSRYTAVTPTRTAVRNWIRPAPLPDAPTPGAATSAGAVDYFRLILEQDRAVAEQLQSVTSQIDRPPLLAKQEERIGWFDAAYADFMAFPADRDV